MQLLRVITITLPHPRFLNPGFPLLCFSIFCPRPQPSDSPMPPYTDTFFITILPDFAFTRLLFTELFPNFSGYIFCSSLLSLGGMVLGLIDILHLIHGRLLSLFLCYVIQRLLRPASMLIEVV
ncbi:hypothetical protein ES319_D04G141600v1 [Gossypium barbadense]|uniref:Uncharacterized protein n=2 Tax=Gossypium TaxID=3633 RepID=A0A5J5RVV5_GOSBA|nr:hypothetical protein ES319_D04G141600v1 [Gossypium barbadense]TYG74043.1 hypothetical protein ES288_D04G150800v1 [Gossypium darwinii]